MTRTILTVLLALFFVATSAGEADADRSRHERMKVSPIKKGGDVVGMKIKMTLRADDASKDTVRINLVKDQTYSWDASNKRPDGTSKSDRARLAGSEKSDILLHKLGEFKNLKSKEIKEVEFEVLYSKAKGIKPGDKIQVVSAWVQSGNTNWHIWGAKGDFGGDGKNQVKVPGKAGAAKKPATAKKPAAKKPAAKKKKKKASAAAVNLRRATTTARAKKPGAAKKPRAKAPAKKKPRTTARTRTRAK
jgi:hypothetical protein